MFRIARETLEAGRARRRSPRRLAPYRAGYTAEERRAIERDLVSGELLGVAATDALELGHRRRPARLRDRRRLPRHRREPAPAVGPRRPPRRGPRALVPAADGLDRFFARHPEALLGRAVEAAILDPESPQIRLGHLRAAAHEAARSRPPTTRCSARAPTRRPSSSSRPASSCARRAGLAWRGADSPAARVSLRSASPDAILIVDEATGAILGRRRRRARALDAARGRGLPPPRRELPGAPARPRASASRSSGRTTLPWYTQPRRDTATTILSRELRRPSARGVQLSLRPGRGRRPGRRLPAHARLPEHRSLDIVPLDLPERRFATAALLVRALGRAARRGRRRPARHAARGRARADLGAAAVRDVRPLGPRRPLDEPPPADRAPDDLRVRGPPRRGRARPARRRPLRGPGRRHRPADRRVPVRDRAARRACSRRSAATSTRRSTRTARHGCSRRWCRASAERP